MDWSKATLGELYEIAYHDEEVSLAFRMEAAEVLKRRARQRFGRVNWREKAVYPR